MEALITLNCSGFASNIVDILKIFQQIGWTIHNSQGKVEYLPIGDNDDYDWQCKKIEEINFYDIVTNKVANNELVGVNLFFNYGDEGISLLAYDTTQVTLGISINRRLIDERHTDMIWYLKNIIYKFRDYGVELLSYRIEEFED